MIKLVFYSKDWSTIERTVNDEYGKYRFLYLEMPNLEKEITELRFMYVYDEQKFDEMVSSLNKQGTIVFKKKESI